MPTWMRYRTAPETAAGLTPSRSLISPAVSPGSSPAISAANTRAAMRGMPMSPSVRAKCSTKRRTASSSRRPSGCIFLSFTIP